MDKDVQEIAALIFQACEDKKAQNIVGIDLTGISSYTDFVFICSASNDRQVRAIADGAQEVLRQKKRVYPLGSEGYDTGTWVLVDFDTVVLHVFLQEMRDFYHLEDLWPEAVAQSAVALRESLLGLESIKKKTVKKDVKNPPEKTKKIAKLTETKIAKDKKTVKKTVAEPVVKKVTKATKVAKTTKTTKKTEITKPTKVTKAAKTKPQKEVKPKKLAAAPVKKPVKNSSQKPSAKVSAPIKKTKAVKKTAVTRKK